MGILTSNEKNIIQSVIELSEEYNFLYNKYEPVSVSIGDGLEEYLKGKSSPNRKKVTIAKENISTFLNELTDDEILTVLTVMYIGRDETSNTDSKQKLLSDMKKEFENTFETRELTIKQMVGKMPLGSYLKDGLEFLEY